MGLQQYELHRTVKRGSESIYRERLHGLLPVWLLDTWRSIGDITEISAIAIAQAASFCKDLRLLPKFFTSLG
jgi:hypothetical protein